MDEGDSGTDCWAVPCIGLKSLYKPNPKPIPEASAASTIATMTAKRTTLRCTDYLASGLKLTATSSGNGGAYAHH
jgi:hypothetical protein